MHLEFHHEVKSYNDVNLGIGKEGDFAKDWSLHKKGLVPTGLPCIVLFYKNHIKSYCRFLKVYVKTLKALKM